MTRQTQQREAAPAPAPDGVRLPDELLDLLRQPSLCVVATLLPDGSPHQTKVWVGTDGKHILINTDQGSQKARNIAEDPRVSVFINDRGQSTGFWEIRGPVVATDTGDAAAESVEAFSQKYLGYPYPGFTGRREERLLLIIAARTITRPVDRRGVAAQQDQAGAHDRDD
jgi:PPOX class probable F420-dependent enzyme